MIDNGREDQGREDDGREVHGREDDGRTDHGREDDGRTDHGREDDGRTDHGPARTDESAKQRWDRNFSDLLQELRVAQTGVQILFAFLLTLPFSARFASVSTFDRATYLVTLLSAALAAGMLIAPVAYHRMLFRQHRKPEVVRSSHRMASGGLAFLMISIVGSVLLVTDSALNRTIAYFSAGFVAVCLLALWGLLPLLRRDDDDDAPPAA